MTTLSMRGLAKKRAGKDFEGKMPDMPEPKNDGPSTGKIPNPVDRSYRKHSTADAVKGRNEREMGHGAVDVKIGEPDLSSTGTESHVEMYAPNKIETRKTDVAKEGTYPDMPEPKDDSIESKKFSMIKTLISHMDSMGK